jgi:uncharacterized protein YndB with AHSA1/START domain
VAPRTRTADGELVITRVIDAPRSLVFKLWTQPEHIARWWGPQGFTTISCQMDIRVGGAYRFGMRSPQGSELWKRGVYREIVEPERIVFTFAWEDADGHPRHELLTTVTFAEEGARTRLTLRQAGFETIEQRDDHVTGWTSCFERFADYLPALAKGEQHHAAPSSFA